MTANLAMVTITYPTGRVATYGPRPVADYLNCTRAGLHNVDFYAIGVVTSLDRVGQCVATYQDSKP